MRGKSGCRILASQPSPSPARRPRHSSSASPLASTEMIANPLIRPLARRLANNLAAMDGGGGILPTFLWEPVNGSFASTRGPTPAFSRASAGTYVDSSGLIQTAAINVPRITYDPTSHECLGYLAEEQRTNILLNSDTLATQS